MIETAPRPTVRTIVASFVFTDLVGFSKGSATDQYAAKARLSSVLRQNLAALRETDYWIKDTGDGALIAFVSNPEHALYMALALAHEYPSTSDASPSSSLRTGLHLGTVKETIDVEARRNFIGDGINAAKRIMDFAHPGQIAASRSFFEAIGNLDSAYGALFEHLGAPDDKHGRAHELYALAPSESVLEKLRADLAADRTGAGEASAASDTNTAKPADSAVRRSGRFALALAGAAVLAIAALFVALQSREPAPSTASVDPPRVPAAGAAPSEAKTNAPAQASPSAAASPSAEGPTRGPDMPSERVPDAVATPKPAEPPATPTAAKPKSEPTRSAAIGSPAKSASEAKPRVSAPTTTTPDTRSAGGPSSPRCTRILEKAALGEPLAPDEKKELANTCR